MRYYVLNPGPPAYIWAASTISPRDHEWVGRTGWRQERRRNLAEVPAVPKGHLVLTRGGILAEPAYRDALRRWEDGDDSAFVEADEASLMAAALKDARKEAAEGCSEAAWLLERDPDPELLYAFQTYAFQTSHAHQGCGWTSPVDLDA